MQVYTDSRLMGFIDRRLCRALLLTLISLPVACGRVSVIEAPPSGGDLNAADHVQPNEPALRRVPLERVAKLARGVHHTRIGTNGLTLARLPDSTIAYLDSRNEVWGIRARCTAGVTIAFTSNTQHIQLELMFEPGIRQADVVNVRVDGALVRQIRPSDSQARPGKVIELPSDGEQRLIELVLPHTCPTYIQGLAIDANAGIAPAPTRPVLLALGDSITQGGYPAVAARQLDMTLHNAGIGGHIFDPGSLTEPFVQTPALITVAFGTNDWSGGRDPDNARAYLQRLRELWPDTPVAVLEPIFRIKPPADADPPTANRLGMTLDAYRDQLAATAEQFDHITVLATKLLLPRDPDLLADGVHPTAKGNIILGHNLAVLLRPFINRTDSANLILGSSIISGSAEQDRPNILLVVADDLGYGDVNYFQGNTPWKPQTQPPAGATPIQTPRLDALAQRGMMFTDFHSNDSVCSPTRAAIMTGRYNHRAGICNVLGQLGNAIKKVNKPGEEPFLGLRPEETTIAEVLKAGGYRTGMFGKWHLGPMDTHHPMDQGFDTFVGTGGNAGDNFSMKWGSGTSGDSYFYRGRDAVDAPGYWHTNVIADEAIKFITDKSDRPFFAYVPFTAPHNPYIGPDDKELANAWDGNEAYGPGPREDKHEAYKEVVEGLDSAIGRILDALDKHGLAENTVVIFTSDNGPVGYGSTGPYRGGKSNLYEGGTRVPTIVCWPGKIPAGSKSDQLGMTMDIFPTLAAIGKCEIPDALKIDGVDLTPLLTQGKTLKARMLYWEKPVRVFMEHFRDRRWAVRDGYWSLVKNSPSEPPELYDLETDPGQSHDLADRYPDRVVQMRKAFEGWKKDVYSDSPWDIDEYMLRFDQAGILNK
jgi:arylsulfatase A-like enzyme/lysophospholipase L1-like esterase